MKYDPVKKVFGDIVSRNVFLRKIFYKLLDLMFLRSWHVRKQIKELYKRNQNFYIFDAGMGFGQIGRAMAKYFPNSKIYAIDVKEEQVDDCEYFFNKTGFGNRVKFKIDDLVTMNYENEFDFILSVDVMEHIHEDRTVFKNFYKALKKGGMLLVNTPSNLGGSDAEDENDPSFIEEHARNGYSKEDITEKLTSAGFKMKTFKYTYGKYGTFSWRFGIKYPILMAGKSKLLILILPFYYLFTLWFVLILMWLDVRTNNPEGTGILLVAEKE
ncbi:MAG TPA: methyltransferase type 11 [Bacteroidetes bacterium]|nr:methyltransferase type 11 [Bacteroidota bacterium]